MADKMKDQDRGGVVELNEEALDLVQGADIATGALSRAKAAKPTLSESRLGGVVAPEDSDIDIPFTG